MATSISLFLFVFLIFTRRLPRSVIRNPESLFGARRMSAYLFLLTGLNTFRYSIHLCLCAHTQTQRGRQRYGV